MIRQSRGFAGEPMSVRLALALARTTVRESRPVFNSFKVKHRVDIGLKFQLRKQCRIGGLLENLKIRQMAKHLGIGGGVSYIEFP